MLSSPRLLLCVALLLLLISAVGAGSPYSAEGEARGSNHFILAQGCTNSVNSLDDAGKTDFEFWSKIWKKITLTPNATLGNYPNTTVQIGANTTITPDTAPTNATHINVSASTDFKGTLTADTASGVVRVTNAYPSAPGFYAIIVTAFDSLGATTTRTFGLMVQTGGACPFPPVFTTSPNVTVGNGPRSIAIGDFNNDGKQDLAIANSSPGTVSIRLGDGSGGFGGTTDIAVGTTPLSVAIGDFNGDGRQDFAVANTNSNTVSIRLGNGVGGFGGTTEISVGTNPQSLVIGDFNNDGKPDFAVANAGSSTVSIRIGDGSGGFNGTGDINVSGSPRSIAIGDFNSDGNQDLASANFSSDTVSIRMGNGSGGFTGTTEVGVGGSALNPNALAIGDFNNDGKQDIAVGKFNSGGLAIRLGDGTGGFAGATNINVGSVAFLAVGDINNDGNQDIIASSNSTGGASICLGNGLGDFTVPASVFATTPMGLAIGDFNNDGRQDLAGTANFGSVAIRLATCNSAPTIVATTGLTRQQGSPAINSQIATVTDDGGNGNVVVTVTSGQSNFVTVSNIVNTNGIITADVIAGCGATNPTANFTLRASDGVSATTTTLNVAVSPNTAPSLTYTNAQSVLLGSSVTVTPTTVGDNGTSSYSLVSVATALTPVPTVNGSGVVTITNAHPVGSHVITIRATDNCGLTTDASFTLDVNVNGFVALSSANYGVNESAGFITIPVNRSGDLSTPVSVDYATSDSGSPSSCGTLASGLASSRCDFNSTSGTLRFAVNESQKSVLVPITQDSYAEGPEGFTISLSSVTGIGAAVTAPASATVTINDAVPPAPNASDDPANFVRQQYHDFLNREADTPGLAFWTNEITSCGTAQNCIDLKCINVSAAFFLSIEFQDTGYLVERIYKASYGSATGTSTFGGTHQFAVPIIRLNEFLPDTQEIGLGVVVGQGNWQQQLDANKAAFTAEFVQRARFTTAFPNTMTAVQFVNTLNTNAGNPLSPGERDQLVNDLATNAKTRAQVLRAVAEDSDLNSAEFNRAFVLMQFFGYLRRNPNDAPDADYTGFDFWLTKLNQFNGNFVNAEMVKAFIVSGEYRSRFGP
jgi:hypothetical protein